MKKTMMPLASFSSGKRDPKTKRQGSWTRVSFLALLVLLMIATTEAGIPCNADAECRRNVCIFSNCASRPTSGGACEANSHCFNAATESCINSKCLAKPALEGTCDDSTDCATSEAICQGAKCLMPDGKTCSANAQCVPPSVCIKAICGAQSPTGGDCDEVADCATAGDACTSNKCASPFDPSLMVWDGNKAPVNSGFSSSPSVSVGKVLYVFEGYTGSALMTVEAYDTMSNTWSSKTGPNIASYYHNVVTVGTNIFLMGGYSDSAGYLKTVYSYDTITNQWDKTWAQLPEAKCFVAVSAVGNTVFTFGGLTGGSIRSDLIHSLDISSQGKSWVQRAKLSITTSHLSATVVNTEIYLLGGTIDSFGTILKTVYKYDSQNPTANPTKNAQNMLETRAEQAAFFDSINKRLYAVGGYGVQNPQNAVEYLDLNNPDGPWASANAYSPSPFSLTNGGLIDSLFHFVANKIFQVLDISVPASVKWSPFPNNPNLAPTVVQLTGAKTFTTVSTSFTSKAVSFYNTATNVWTAAAPSVDFPGPGTYNSASAVVNGELYVIGGDNGFTGSVSNVYVLNAARTAWSQQDSLADPGISGACAAADGTNIFVYGGVSGYSSMSNTLFKMDTTKTKGAGQWSTITPDSGSEVPTAVAFCAAVIASGKLLIFGGSTERDGSTPTEKIQSYNIATNKWEAVSATLITPRAKFSAALLKGFVFLIGGTKLGSNLNKVEVFDVNTNTVTAITDMPTPRYGLGSVTDGSSIFSVGGSITSGIYFPSLEKLHTP